MNLTSACHVFMDYCSWSKRTFSNLTYSGFQGQINLILRWKFLWISAKLWANIWNIWLRRSLEKTSRWKKVWFWALGEVCPLILPPNISISSFSDVNNEASRQWQNKMPIMIHVSGNHDTMLIRKWATLIHRITMCTITAGIFFLKRFSPNVPPGANSLASAPSKQISTFCQIWARNLQMFCYNFYKRSL